MDGSKSYFVFVAFRNFVPMSSFMIPYMIENKNFTMKEVMNKITHCVFILSIVTAVVSIFITDVLGKKTICILDAGIELLVSLIMLLMGQRSFLLGQITGGLHGVTKSLETISKSIMYSSSDTNRGSAYANYTVVKYTSAILSCVCGQELYFMTHSHKLSVIVSTGTLSIAFIYSFMLGKSDIDRMSGWYEETVKTIKGPHRESVIIFCLLNVISNTLLIATSCYSTYIFIERKKGVEIASNNFGRVLYALFFPIRLVIVGIAKVVSLFDSSMSPSTKYDKNVLIFGYMEALGKLAGIIPRYYIIKRHFSDSARAAILFLLLASTMGLTYIQHCAKTLLNTYILSMLCLVTSISCLGISNNGFVKYTKSVHVFYCINLLLSATIHASISYFSKKKGVTAEKRLLYYCYFDIIMMVLAMSLCFLYIFNVHTK